MCGRFAHLYNWRRLHRLLTLTSPSIEIPLRYNLAPSQVAPVVRDTSERERTLAMLRWGFAVPAAASSRTIINARSETLAQKPAFRDAFHRRRCVVPISGFYEWEVPRETDLFGVSRPVAGDPPKQPHYITAVDGEPMLLAGLWSPGDPAVFVIVTTTPNAVLAPLHDRMPVILSPADASRWLDPDADGTRVQDLLVPCPADLLTRHRVSGRVNSPRNDSPLCVQTIDSA